MSLFGYTFKLDVDTVHKVAASAAVAAALAALGVIQVNLPGLLDGHATVQIIAGALVTAAIAALSKK